MSGDRAADRQRLVGCLAGGVAHDFNNLLATVLGCLELMERRTGDPERLQALIKRASDAVERAAGLTSGLVHFARRQPETSREVDLAAAVQSTAPLIASALGRRIDFVQDLRPDTPRIEADPAALEACLTALCVAARDALPDGGKIILSSRGGDSAAVTVQALGTDSARWDLELVTRSALAANGTVARTGPDEVSVMFAV